MKFSILERVIAGSLLCAATVAIASGMNTVEPRKDDPDSTLRKADDIAEMADDPEEQVESSDNDDREAEASDEVSEQSIDKLVEAVVKATVDEKEQKRDELKAALATVFQKKLEAQRARIAAIRERIDAIEAQIDKRSNLEEQIVQRRMSELLGEADELSWDHSPRIEFDMTDRRDRGDDVEWLTVADQQNFWRDRTNEAALMDKQKQFQKFEMQAAERAKQMAEAVRLREEIRRPDENQLRELEARIKHMDAQKEQLRRQFEELSKLRKR